MGWDGDPSHKVFADMDVRTQTHMAVQVGDSGVNGAGKYIWEEQDNLDVTQLLCFEAVKAQEMPTQSIVFSEGYLEYLKRLQEEEYDALITAAEEITPDDPLTSFEEGTWGIRGKLALKRFWKYEPSGIVDFEAYAWANLLAKPGKAFGLASQLAISKNGEEVGNQRSVRAQAMETNAFRLVVSYVAEFPQCFDFQTGAANQNAAYLLRKCSYTSEVLSVFPESEVQYQEKMQAKYENKMRTSPNTRGLSFGARDSLPPKGWIYGESQTKAHIAEVTSKKALEKYNQASALKKVLEKFKQSPGSVSEGTTGLASSVGAQGGPTTPADGLARLKQVLMRGDTVPMDEGEYLREMTLCLKNSIQQYGTFTMSEEKEWFDKLKEELTIFHTKTFEAKHDREPTLEELDQFFQVVMCDGP
mmetsp:Transcript_28452/g.47776  ORF Transcript_28452/g.47776 Transcript_28452/m.47776 type:complete len:416 (+) Transcript_28452:491-1738(+)